MSIARQADNFCIFIKNGAGSTFIAIVTSFFKDID